MLTVSDSARPRMLLGGLAVGLFLFTAACNGSDFRGNTLEEADAEFLAGPVTVAATSPVVATGAPDSPVNSPSELKRPSKVVSLSHLYTDILFSSGFSFGHKATDGEVAVGFPFTGAPLPPGLIAVSGAARADVPSSVARVDANDTSAIAALKPDMIIVDCLSFGSPLSPEDFEAKAQQLSADVNEKNAGSSIDLVFRSNALTQKALDQEVNRFGSLFKIDNLVKVLSDIGETTPLGRQIYPPVPDASGGFVPASSPTATCALPAPTEPTPATTPAAPTNTEPTATQPPVDTFPAFREDITTADTACFNDGTGFVVTWETTGDPKGPQPGVVLETGSQDFFFDDEVLNGRGEVTVDNGSTFISGIPVPTCNAIPTVPTTTTPQDLSCEERGFTPEECAAQEEAEEADVLQENL